MSIISKGKVAVFVGPTAAKVKDKLSFIDKKRFTLYPPIKRNDISELSDDYDTIVIVDGLFHSVPAVGHIEIRKALFRKTIYGCSSMGAIRAYEMRNLGMVGYGEVYNMFFNDDDFMDDELAHLHGPGPDYIWFSYPLVNLRFFFNKLVYLNVINNVQMESVFNQLKLRYYGDRTDSLLEILLSRYIEKPEAKVLIRKYIPETNIKSKDFLNLLIKLHDCI